MQRYCSASARELARLVGTSQAPVIQHYSETISRSTTIRSFEQESRFNDINMKLIDRYSQPKLYSATAMAWLILRLDILSTLTFAYCLVFLISLPNSMTAPGESTSKDIHSLLIVYSLWHQAQNSFFIPIFFFFKELQDWLWHMDLI